jgi:glycine cleavage system H protein
MAETRYTKDHEWVRLEDDGTLTIGITDHAQEALGDIVFVELPLVDRDVVEGETVATVESTKAASDVFAPIGGRIAEINENIVEEPGLINRDPTGEGWFWRMTRHSIRCWMRKRMRLFLKHFKKELLF